MSEPEGPFVSVHASMTANATELIVTTYQEAVAAYLASLTEQVIDGGMPLQEWMERISSRLAADRELGTAAVVADYERRAGAAT